MLEPAHGLAAVQQLRVGWGSALPASSYSLARERRPNIHSPGEIYPTIRVARRCIVKQILENICKFPFNACQDASQAPGAVPLPRARGG
jgi:hypothetical protein